MTATAEVILSEKMLLVFRFFCKQIAAFWFAKSKAVNFSFQDYFDRSICNFQRLAGQKTILVQSLCKLNFKCEVKSSLQHAGALISIQRDRFKQTSLKDVCSMYWPRYKSQIREPCSSNNF